MSAGADPAPADTIEAAVLERYKQRSVAAFGAEALAGLTVGVYQQSTVARDLLVETLRALGATAVPLGRATSFIPVDTEAHRPEDVALLADWARDGRFDALVSADGDADRPLVADAAGRILRGDVLGLLVARALGIAAIVTPVTSSAAIESCGIAKTVRRTRVGSPFVIAGMLEAAAEGATVLGFEANGGCLLGSDVVLPTGRLDALPTRDAMLPIVCALLAARMPGGLAAAVAALGAGHAMADRLQDIPPEASGAFLRDLATPAYADHFFTPIGVPAATDRLDGVRVQLSGDGVIHYRASGNAPELRCYAEAATAERAEALLRWGLASAAAVLSPTT
ncbi:phosphomannomutase [Lichenihabitans sp. Uapishka_5]|uniref:phosphomannomutase n=1 Tax=Lichenihabitans sp. Uapishka_5 TaxID=3037302 RepID=UPI0029E80498|nr:phosphomannomutase [Lichenihabitans sp. Uapishka_5]MDX7952517.1 phosphomannomutase [Lichenihabitans sp. Uapishka_5]